MQALTDQELQGFSRLMADAAGIHLPASKKALVSSRLARRLQALGHTSYTQYLEYLRRDASERQQAVDLLTTNETYFFREPRHFAYLAEHIVPAADASRPLRVWSAACSSGEEPYSVAMVLAERMGSRPWEIVASDISTRMLQLARAGVYPMERAQRVPPAYLKAYCLRGVGAQQGRLAVQSWLRERVRFESVNLNGAWPELGRFDLIWLRNVMIYFEAPTKRSLVARLTQSLRPGGHLFIGHSESLGGMEGELQAVQPAVYRRRAGAAT